MDWQNKMFWPLSFIFCAFSFNEAHSTSSTFTKSLMHSRTPMELHSAIERRQNLDILRLSCRLELKETLIPVSCFELLRRKGGQIESIKKDKLMLRLNQLCARAILADHFPQKLQPSAELSPECRARLSAAIQIRDYRNLDPSQSPSDRDLTH